MGFFKKLGRGVKKLARGVGILAAVAAVPAAFLLAGTVLFTFGMPIGIAIVGAFVAATVTAAVGIEIFSKEKPKYIYKAPYKPATFNPGILLNGNSYAPKPSFKPPFFYPGLNLNGTPTIFNTPKKSSYVPSSQPSSKPAYRPPAPITPDYNRAANEEAARRRAAYDAQRAREQREEQARRDADARRRAEETRRAEAAKDAAWRKSIEDRNNRLEYERRQEEARRNNRTSPGPYNKNQSYY